MSLRAAGMVVVLVAVTVVGGATPAVAQKADVREVKARELFAVGKYAEALDIYGKLYAETTHPTYLRNIGRCYQNMGEPTKAISSFREYLRQAKDLPPDQRAQVESYVREMEDLKRRRETPAAPPVTPPAAGFPTRPPPTMQAPTPTPAPTPASAPIPSAIPQASPPPPPATTAVGGTASATPPPGTAPGANAARSRRITAFVVGGIAIGALTTGALFGIRAISKRSSSDAECPMEKCSPEGVALNNQAKTAARVSDFAFGAGIVGVAVATYLLLSPASGDASGHGTPMSGLRLSPDLGPSEARLSLEGSW